MIRRIILFFFIITCCIFSTGYMQNFSYDLLKAKTIICKFNNGSTGFLKQGVYDIRTAYDPNMMYTFDSLDHKQKTGRIIGNKGASDVFIDEDIFGINLIEITMNGGRIYTTIFAIPDKDGLYFATTSRHLHMQDEPLTSQWYGKCKITDYHN